MYKLKYIHQRHNFLTGNPELKTKIVKDLWGTGSWWGHYEGRKWGPKVEQGQKPNERTVCRRAFWCAQLFLHAS